MAERPANYPFDEDWERRAEDDAGEDAEPPPSPGDDPDFYDTELPPGFGETGPEGPPPTSGEYNWEDWQGMGMGDYLPGDPSRVSPYDLMAGVGARDPLSTTADAATMATGPANLAREGQAGLVDLASRYAQGEVPESVRQMEERGMQRVLGMGATARGQPTAATQRQMMAATAEVQRGAQEAAAKGQQEWAQVLGGQATQMRGQDLDMAARQAGFEQEANMIQTRINADLMTRRDQMVTSLMQMGVSQDVATMQAEQEMARLGEELLYRYWAGRLGAVTEITKQAIENAGWFGTPGEAVTEAQPIIEMFGGRGTPLPRGYGSPWMTVPEEGFEPSPYGWKRTPSGGWQYVSPPEVEAASGMAAKENVFSIGQATPQYDPMNEFMSRPSNFLGEDEQLSTTNILGKEFRPTPQGFDPNVPGPTYQKVRDELIRKEQAAQGNIDVFNEAMQVSDWVSGGMRYGDMVMGLGGTPEQRDNAMKQIGTEAAQKMITSGGEFLDDELASMAERQSAKKLAQLPEDTRKLMEEISRASTELEPAAVAATDAARQAGARVASASVPGMMPQAPVVPNMAAMEAAKGAAPGVGAFSAAAPYAAAAIPLAMKAMTGEGDPAVETAKAASGALGAAGGAAAGTAILPGVGTAIGGTLGSLLGTGLTGAMMAKGSSLPPSPQYASLIPTAPRNAYSGMESKQYIEGLTPPPVSSSLGVPRLRSSGEATKSGIQPHNEVADFLRTIEPIRFDYRPEFGGEKNQYGFSADQAETKPMGASFVRDDMNGNKMVDTGKAAMVGLAAASDLQRQQDAAGLSIAELHRRLQALEGVA